MNFDFELFLTLAVIISGTIYLIDVIWWAPSRNKHKGAKLPLLVDYARSFFPILLIVLLLRSFLLEPFRIPSGSEKPELLVGDFLLTNKFSYGVRLPVLHTQIIPVGHPKRGDIMVFRYPPNPSIYYIKRVIGLPGDNVVYRDKVLYINGQQATQKMLGYAVDNNEDGILKWPVILKEENLLGVTHKIYLREVATSLDNFQATVPPASYLVMGDNRDNSSDSRVWGFVPEENLVGKAKWIFFSWNNENHKVRWDRIGKTINP